MNTIRVLSCQCAVNTIGNMNAKKLPPLAFRPDADVREALEADAEAEERSMSWLINRILREHYGLEKHVKSKAVKGARSK